MCSKYSIHSQALWLYHQNTHKYTLKLLWNPGFLWIITLASTPTQTNKRQFWVFITAFILFLLFKQSLRWPVSVLDLPVGLCCHIGFTASASVANSLCKRRLMCTYCAKDTEASESNLKIYCLTTRVYCDLINLPNWRRPFWSFTTGNSMALLTNYCLNIQPQNNHCLKNVNKTI